MIQEQICPKCGARNSRQKKVCFRCNHQLIASESSSKSLMIGVGIFFLIILIAIGFSVINPKNSRRDIPQTKNTYTAKPTSVESLKLILDYEGNEVQADNEYKDKLLRISGKVEKIETTMSGRAMVTLKNELRHLTDKSVVCYFADEEKPSVAKLIRGQEVKIQGVGGGKIINVIAIYNCLIE